MKILISIGACLICFGIGYGYKYSQEQEAKRLNKLHQKYVRRTLYGAQLKSVCMLCGIPKKGTSCPNKKCPGYGREKIYR